MSLPVPLAVRLVTSRGDKHITRELRDLVFRETAMGGWASARMLLDRPLIVDPDEIAHYGRAYVYDGRNGRTVWEGRLEDPGRGAREDGQVWELGIMGPAAHAYDWTGPLVYVDTDLGAFARNATDPSARIGVGDDPGGSGVDALVATFPTGMAITLTSVARGRYTRLLDAGMKLARVSYTWDAGRNDSNFQAEALTRTGLAGSPATPASDNLTTSGGSVARVVVTDWTNGHNVLDLQLESDAASTLTDDTFWASFRAVVVRSMLYDKAAAERTTGYTLDTVVASEIVADLLGRRLTQYDGANAVVTTTTYAIDKLAWPDGVSPGRVLDELVTLEPGFRWGAYESNAAGKHRFEWLAWPTTIRYEATVLDGFDGPGSADGLYNAVTVRYRDSSGVVRTTTRTSTVAVLTAAGLTRTGFIDLGDNLGSLANAQQAGDYWLADHGTAPNAGRLTVARPILDNRTGRMVQPWEIKAGELIRVRGVMPKPGSLSAVARDGSTVFRIQAKEYAASRASARLDLDASYQTTAQMLADLSRDRLTRRR